MASSIKNRKVYEALLRKGYSESAAAAISNAMVKKGRKKRGSDMTRKREFRQVNAEYRMDKGKDGRIIADVLNYDKLDDYGTTFAPQVFTESMDRRMPRICWGHDWADPLGQWVDKEDTRQKLRLVGDLDLDMIRGTQTPAVPSAHRAYAQLKSGTIDEFSVGFIRLQDERASSGKGTRITKGLLDEVSPVLIGSVPGTKLISVRSTRTSVAAPAGSSLWVPATVMQDILVRYESGTIDLGDALAELKASSIAYDELPDPDADEDEEITTETEEEESEDELPEGWSDEDLDVQLAELGLELENHE